jgi:hypothetical protein
MHFGLGMNSPMRLPSVSTRHAPLTASEKPPAYRKARKTPIRQIDRDLGFVRKTVPHQTWPKTVVDKRILIHYIHSARELVLHIDTEETRTLAADPAARENIAVRADCAI